MPTRAHSSHPDTRRTRRPLRPAASRTRATGRRRSRPACAMAGVPDRHRPVAIAFAAQQHGAVVLDAHGNVVRPAKLWNDTESAV